MHLLTQRGSSLAARTCRANTPKWNNTYHAYLYASVFSRHYHEQRSNVAAVVVGAGPAGIAVVGNLLEHLPADAGKITWIDPEFEGGRIKRYSQVPSNTKIGLFLEYARAVEPFREIFQDSPKPNAITALEAMPRDETCPLGFAGDMLRHLTRGLEAHERVTKLSANVTGSKWEDYSWELELKALPGQQRAETPKVKTPMVVYCTGSFPTTMELPYLAQQKGTQRLYLDKALSPTLLEEALVLDKSESNPTTRVGVVGSSHSAVLVLMNLVRLAQTARPDIRVYWFSRSPTFKYAEQKDGWILYDNTGLKGLAAQFARAELDGDRLLTSEAGKIITRIDCSGGPEAETAAMEKWGQDCRYMVQAIGFTRRQIPVNGVFNHRTGAFDQLKGVYGAGIAFPEQVTDPAGNTEYAVGFWKFMKFLKRVVPAWVEQVHKSGGKSGIRK